jgi:hypothetical protein
MIYDLLYGSIVLLVALVILWPDIGRAWSKRKQRKRWGLD